MLDRVYNTIKKYRMVEPGDNIVIAVSGGPDSVALLLSLYELKSRLEINELVIAHLNHMLRGEEAREDARFVGELAARLHLRAVIEKKDVPGLIKEEKLSPEDAARKARYEFLHSIAEKFNAKIAVGHHADDQAETLLMHLLQGSGTDGLAAMSPVRGKIIRPLLFIRRKEIEEFCEKRRITPRLDKTNRETIYLRNKIRIELIPLLTREYNPNLIQNLLHTADIMREENNILYKLTKKVFSSIVVELNSKKVAVSLKEFIKQERAVKRRLVRYMYGLLNSSVQDVSFKHVEDVIGMAEKSQVGSVIKLPAGIEAKKSYDELIITFVNTEKEIGEFFYFLPVPGRITLEECKKIISTDVITRNEFKTEKFKKLLSGNGTQVLIDYNKINGPLYVRNRRRGDRFNPYGMKGAGKKIKDFFIDEKIPREKRDCIPLVTCGKNGENIVWVAGMRVSDKFKVVKDSQKILHIRIEEL